MAAERNTIGPSTGRLEGKVVILTGATGGIGRAIMRRFLAEGARLVLSGRRDPDATAAATRFVRGDVRHEAHAAALVAEALAAFGRLDVLVNAHGRDFHSDLAETDIDAARAVIEVNLLGCLSTMKHAIPAMVAGGGGSIVNVASRLGSVAIPGQAVYSASKGGLIMLTRGAAIDLGRHNIRVNAIAPGITDTEMIGAWVRDQPDPGGFRRALESSIPMGRLAGSDEIAAATLFLASDDASYVTGAVLMADGGYTAA